ncbi:hypothetical protein MtrunA17_Chr8g0349221 [Medicago truncatula]|uniref:Transmembrane protein n=1 Tax=Medicago truncatula TaxID=3880 RepID=A0A396GF05_MEDTR|nr:hypothetical protein MtrunA17_Chr8g0349221 [Medicago truncatula]
MDQFSETKLILFFPMRFTTKPLNLFHNQCNFTSDHRIGVLAAVPENFFAAISSFFFFWVSLKMM